MMMKTLVRCSLLVKQNSRLPLTCATSSTGQRSIVTYLQCVYVERITNRYLPSRVINMGADAACAHWLLSCGAHSVRFEGHKPIQSAREVSRLVEEAKQTRTELVQSVEKQTSKRKMSLDDLQREPLLKLVEIDASDAVIHGNGCKYFKNCYHVQKLTVNFCDYLDDHFLREHIAPLRQSLTHLEMVSALYSDHALRQLIYCKNLKSLHLYLMLNVKDRYAVLKYLQANLPNCKVTFPETTTFGFHRS